MTNKKLISQTLARRIMSSIAEYELIKCKQILHFKIVKEFCAYHKFSHQNFMKIYYRYKQNPDEQSLIAQKRGQKFKVKRFDLEIEKEIVFLRELVDNRYEIRKMLKMKYLKFFATTIYKVFKKYGLSKLIISAKEEGEKSS